MRLLTNDDIAIILGDVEELKELDLHDLIEYDDGLKMIETGKDEYISYAYFGDDKEEKKKGIEIIFEELPKRARAYISAKFHAKPVNPDEDKTIPIAIQIVTQITLFKEIVNEEGFNNFMTQYGQNVNTKFDTMFQLLQKLCDKSEDADELESANNGDAIRFHNGKLKDENVIYMQAKTYKKKAHTAIDKNLVADIAGDYVYFELYHQLTTRLIFGQIRTMPAIANMNGCQIGKIYIKQN